MKRGPDDDLTGLLHDGIRRHGVVGCGLAVLADGVVREYAAGVADVRTGEPMRTDTVCFIGSTTKVYTATLLMQLVDQGRVDLDAPVRTYLPDFTVADDDAVRALTVRHLLAHQTGLGVGAYADYGRGDDAVARFVGSMRTQPSIHPPGQRWGYSNAGFVIAGRIAEVVTGCTWDEAMREVLLGPGGLTSTMTLPEDVLLHPVAKPHELDADGTPRVSARWGVAGRSLGPTGSTMVATAGDLVRFAGIHLAGGAGPDGRQLITADSVELMQARHADVPAGWPYGDGWCLGWYTGTWGSTRMVGHTGHNIGAGSHLAVLPEVGGAVAMVFNSVPGDATLHHELFSTVAREVWGLEKPAPWLPEQPHPLVGPVYEGVYRNDLGELAITVDGDHLVVDRRAHTPVDLANGRATFRSVTAGAFGSGQLAAHAAQPPPGHITPQLFFDGFDAEGRPEFLYESVFVLRRVQPA